MKTKTLRRLTSFREKMLARNRAFNREYDELLKRPGQSITELNRYMMEKYDIHSTDTLYKIRRQAVEGNGEEES